MPAAAEVPVCGLSIAKVRKSYPSQVNKSNVKKHGSFPTAEQQIFELWSASFIEGANFAVNDRSCIRQGIRDRDCL